MRKYILNTGRTPIGLTIPPKLRKGKETRIHFPPCIGAIDTGLTGDEKYELVEAKFFIEVDRELVAGWLNSSGAYFDEGMLKVFDERPTKTSLPEAAKTTINADELVQRETDLAKREAQAKVNELKVKSDEAMLLVTKSEVTLEQAENAKPKNDEDIKTAKGYLKSAKAAATKARKAHEEAAKAFDEEYK